MEIIGAKFLQSQMKMVIQYEENDIRFGLIISLENVIKDYKTIEKLKELLSERNSNLS